MTYTFDPLVPRPIDLPTQVPLTTPLSLDQLAALDEAKIFAAPSEPAQRPAWRAALRQWREEARLRYGYTGQTYDRPGAAWAAGCSTIAQVWLWDELLYSFAEARFTPDRFLADARERFGGLDAVVLWHAYPIIGIDDRNQWDYYRDVPGLADLIGVFHDAGLGVFVDYNPWDVGTRQAGPDVEELAALVADLRADGVFLDTLKKAEPELVAVLEQARPGIVLEGESKLATARIEDHSASWAQFFADSPVPGVLRAHWFERRHMQHHVRRWHRDHSAELQSAWLNGVGVMVWEVVFGAWVGWSARDAATVRRLVAVQRAARELLLAGDWEPLTELAPQAEMAGVYASRWRLAGITLWTLANRGEEDYAGPLLPEALGAGTTIDLSADGDGSPSVPARGIAALLHVAEGTEPPAWLPQLQAALAECPQCPDASFPHRLAERIVPARADRVGSGPSPASGPPTDAVIVPAGRFVLSVRYRARETGMYQGAPYVDEWKPLPPRLHDARMLQRTGELPAPVAVCATEVTNAEFEEFMCATGYRPADPHRFLQHWPNGRCPRRDANCPVTFVDLADARAYCAWRGGRLPTEDEWQLAGQTGRLTRGEPAVWNWTESEHSDGRSRFCILKGGADYCATGSQWYLEGGRHEPEYSVKYLLPGLGLQRGATIGFRCAWDLPARTEVPA